MSPGPNGNGRQGNYKAGSSNQLADQKNLSPTRRFKKNDNSFIDSQMLGAGTDPMAREGEFSNLAGKASNLINANFVKPNQMKIRFPAVLDQFSRTIGAPVSEMRYNLNPCGRIGSNYTPSAKTLYLDIHDKCVKNIQTNKLISFQANKEFLQTTATIEEEIMHHLYKIQNPELEARVRAKRVCYDRYMLYVEQEIGRDQVAPIRQYWINDILDLIPGEFENLSKEFIEMSIDRMLGEIGEYYYNAIRKAILDYVLLNEDERLRLGIMEVFKPVKSYGDNIYGGIEPDTNWKNSVIYATEEMYDKLVICNHATLEIQNMWQVTNKKQFKLLTLPKMMGEEREAVSIEAFANHQNELIQNAQRGIVGEYSQKIQEIYLTVLQQVGEEEYYAQLFFESSSVLISNLLRSHVTETILEYEQFFERYFDKEENRDPETVIREEEENLLESGTEHVFLKIELKIVNDGGNNLIDFADPLEEVQGNLLDLMTQMVKITHGIFRPEHKFAKTDKQYLMEVPLDDQTYVTAYRKIQKIVEKNLATVEKVLEIYNKYSYVLSEDTMVGKFIAEKPDRKEYTQIIQQYENLYEQVKENCPFFIRLNMVEIDAREIKIALLNQIENLIRKLQVEGIHQHIMRLNTDLRVEIQSLLEVISKSVDSTKTLVDLETRIDQIRNIDEKKLMNNYKELCAWLTFMLNLTMYRETNKRENEKEAEDELKEIHKTSVQIFNMMNKVEEEDDRLKAERERTEQELKERKVKFIADINTFLKDIEELETFQTRFAAKDINAKIRVYNDRLNEMLAKRQVINEDEVLLGWEESEFPNLVQGQNQLNLMKICGHQLKTLITTTRSG